MIELKQNGNLSKTLKIIVKDGERDLTRETRTRTLRLQECEKKQKVQEECIEAPTYKQGGSLKRKDEKKEADDVLKTAERLTFRQRN